MLSIKYNGFIDFVKSYGIAGNDDVGNESGHTEFPELHPVAISIHTLLYRDPEGRVALMPLGYPGNAPDNDTFKPVHSMVPSGHGAFHEDPSSPIGPVTPADPDIYSDGMEHDSILFDNPSCPLAGATFTVPANDADFANTVDDMGKLTLVAVFD